RLATQACASPNNKQSRSRKWHAAVANTAPLHTSFHGTPSTSYILPKLEDTGTQAELRSASRYKKTVLFGLAALPSPGAAPPAALLALRPPLLPLPLSRLPRRRALPSPLPPFEPS
ncbi:unnamed protein product, partial [Ectocarpus sp. 12 AP-2014]